MIYVVLHRLPPLNDTRTYLPTFYCSAIISLKYFAGQSDHCGSDKRLEAYLESRCHLWTVVMASNPMQDQVRSPSPNFIGEDRAYLDARDNPRQIANRIARGRQRLGYYTVLCFLVNRIIGTGLFVSPGTVITGTQSVGFSLLFWLFGAISFFAVSYLYVEFGLNVPRYNKIPVPRNGGELNYVRYK